MLYLRILAIILFGLTQSASAWTHGKTVISRILFIGYGQSNEEGFFSTQGNPPAAAPNTFFYDPNIPGVTTVPNAEGIRTLQNTVTTATGLPTISMVCAISGSTLANLSSGGPGPGQTGYQGCINQALANVLPTDQVIFIWDQGEGDADASPIYIPDHYAPLVVTLHANLAAAIGRTTATAPWISASKGSASNVTGFGWSGGITPLSWHVTMNGIKAGTDLDPHMYWYNQYDETRGDQYHYYNGIGNVALRIARHITTLMGYTSGVPIFPLGTAAVVDATHTTLNVVQNLGTDWTPTSGATGTNGIEVSGDNGVTWINAAHSHASATQITLTHASLSTTNARLVRYLYGFMPPDVDGACTGPPPPTCDPPTKMIFDNSSLTLPLSPTTWDLRATGLTTLPMPTWRDYTVLSGSGQTQALTANAQLGPASENFRKFLILSFAGPTFSGGGAVTISSLTVTPQDFLGNNVGTPVVLSSPTLDQATGQLAILGVPLNSNNAGATTFSLSVTYSASPFNGTSIQAWTVPYADLSSTTKTGSGGSTTTTSLTGTTTLNVSAGGFVIAAGYSTTNQVGTGTFSFTGTESYGVRWANISGIPTMSGDASNAGANAASALTATFNASGTVYVAAVAWR